MYPKVASYRNSCVRYLTREKDCTVAFTASFERSEYLLHDVTLFPARRSSVKPLGLPLAQSHVAPGAKRGFFDL